MNRRRQKDEEDGEGKLKKWKEEEKEEKKLIGRNRSKIKKIIIRKDEEKERGNRIRPLEAVKHRGGRGRKGESFKRRRRKRKKIITKKEKEEEKETGKRRLERGPEKNIKMADNYVDDA